MTSSLDSTGRYEGFDIVEEGIAWCSEHISPRYPNFNFVHADIYNARYNPDGRIQSADFVFPYEDESFDFVLATSVFTHMLPGDVEHYLMEIVRVLRPAGRTLITFLLLNDESLRLTEADRSMLAFPYDRGSYGSLERIFPKRLSPIRRTSSFGSTRRWGSGTPQRTTDAGAVVSGS